MICPLGTLQLGANAEDLRGFFSYIWSGSRTGLCLCRVCITFRAEFTGTSTQTGSLNKHSLQISKTKLCIFFMQIE